MLDDASREEELRALVSRLGIAIEDFRLLNQALTHASLISERRETVHDYEALEFLGDAVLGLAVAHWLFDRIPNRTPGEYSRMRAGIVNRRVVAEAAIPLEIAACIRLGKGEELSGGRMRQALLADCLEALIGALYVDQGWDAAHAFVVRVFERQLERECASGTVWDFKSRLQDYCQVNRFPLPVFRVIHTEGPDHRKEFEVEVLVREEPAGRGRGTTKKEAEQNAARLALIHEGQPVT